MTNIEQKPLPKQWEVDAVAEVFKKLGKDPIASNSAIIVTSMLKDAIIPPHSNSDYYDMLQYIVQESRFLVARLDKLDFTNDMPKDFMRDWNGHVDPPLYRLNDALRTLSVMSRLKKDNIDQIEKISNALEFVQVAHEFLNGYRDDEPEKSMSAYTGHCIFLLKILLDQIPEDEKKQYEQKKANAGWYCFSTAPKDGRKIRVKTGEMTFLAKYEEHGYMNEGEADCGAWVACEENHHPPCWNDGVMWQSNENQCASETPTHWQPYQPAQGGNGE